MISQGEKNQTISVPDKTQLCMAVKLYTETVHIQI